MHNKIYLVVLLTTVALAACSDDAGNNGASNNGNNANNGAGDTGTDTGADTTDDTGSDTQEEGLSVLSIQPASGPLAGGTDVSISGTGFVDGATVTIGGTEAEATYVSKFQIDATTPAGTQTGPVDITVENSNGDSATLTGGFEYTDDTPPLSIGWCVLQHPDATTVTVDTETEAIFGRVYVENCSEADAQCAQVHAELGWAPEGEDPTTDANKWTWTAASYNDGHTDDDNDEYEATLTPNSDGNFAFAYRFSLDGTNWTYCDLDNSDNGFQTDQTGELTVEAEQTNTVEIGWCNLQHPDATSTDAGTDTELIYGRVYSDGCTDGAAECAEITAQVGFGPDDGDPTSDASVYTWVDATYNGGHTDDNNDEYQAALSPQTTCSYTYAYRFSGDGGQTWTYCDLDDITNGFQTAQMGALTVN